MTEWQREEKEEQATVAPTSTPWEWLASALVSAHSSCFSSRYNPENLATLERYVETQAKENAYDLEANLAVLKLWVSASIPTPFP